MVKALKYKVLFVLFIISFLASAVLSFIPLARACGGVQTTCYVVQTSDYETIWGIKNAYLGLLAFGIISILAIFQIEMPKKSTKNLISAGVIFASIVAIYFLYIQFFVLDALCKYCMVIDIASLLSLGIVIFWKDKKSSFKRPN